MVSGRFGVSYTSVRRRVVARVCIDGGRSTLHSKRCAELKLRVAAVVRSPHTQATWARESRRVHSEEKREKLKAVAAERRRWKVRFFNADGKPDKRRPPGRPWAKEAFAGPERDVFCGGDTADLFAISRNMTVTSLAVKARCPTLTSHVISRHVRPLCVGQ